MPLRKPDELPKIPKTRKKSIDKLIETQPEKKQRSGKKPEIEFLVSVLFSFDEMQKKQFYVVSLETTKIFSALNYEISVDVRKSRSVIDISILGLNMVPAYLVKAAPARTDLFFEELYGEYCINIIKQDGSINSARFDFNIFKKEIILLEEVKPGKKNTRTFCSFSVNPEHFSFEKGK